MHAHTSNNYNCMHILDLNSLGLRDEPTLQPQHTQFSSPKKAPLDLNLRSTVDPTERIIGFMHVIIVVFYHLLPPAALVSLFFWRCHP